METEFIKDLMVVNNLVQFLLDVAKLALGFALGGYVALRLARRKGE